MMVDVNYVTVLIATIAAMAVGFLWYSPVLFAKPWMKEMGLTDKSMKESQKKMGGMYALSMVFAFVTAYVLYHVAAMGAYFYQMTGVMPALQGAFWSWLGFIMPVQATDVLFGGKSWKLFFINTGYQLASVMVMGLVIGLMG
jgi:hypothetical protein